METRRGAVPAAGEQRGPGPGPGTAQGGGGEQWGGHHRRAASRGREWSEASRGRGSTQPGAPGPCPALPLSRAGRRGPHGSRRRDRAAAGRAAGAARAPRRTHPEDGGDRLLLRGPRCGWMVQGAGPARPGGHKSRGCEEDGPGPGRVCTVLPRLLPRHHRSRERSVCGGKLVQDPAGLRGCPAHQLLCKCWREVKAASLPPSPGRCAGSAHQRGGRAGLLRVPSGHPVPCLGAAMGSDLATGADCQLLLRPSEPQAGSCPVRGHCLELLPLLESKSGVRGEAVSRGCSHSLSAS
ncbi:protein Mpv17 isoform X1 [Cygnus olor]|uniref:protein Mpv17 isoform X1 n=1 Tax=Cygnus olor TaxID=8869 RepID=UPI001ADE1D3A|nr:protein Mpv17 isoform X1 [Cygnus olor]